MGEMVVLFQWIQDFNLLLTFAKAVCPEFLTPPPPRLSIPSRLCTQAEAKSFHPCEVTDGTSSSSENVGEEDIKGKNPPSAPIHSPCLCFL